MPNLKRKFVPLEEAFDIPSTPEEFLRGVETQRLESSETTEVKKEKQPKATEKYEVRFLKLPKNLASKIYGPEDFTREFDKELKKLGLSHTIDKTELPLTQEYEVNLRPFQKKPLSEILKDYPNIEEDPQGPKAFILSGLGHKKK